MPELNILVIERDPIIERNLLMASGASEESGLSRKSGRPIRVWDLPTLVFHWLLVTFVMVSFVSGKIEGAWMQYHLWSGYAIMRRGNDS